MEKLEGTYYFIAGAKQIHKLNHDYKSDVDEFYSRKLSSEEIETLAVEVVWTGDENKEYSDNDGEAFDLLVSLIRNMNMMQDPDFHSFPLGKLLINSAPSVLKLLGHKKF